MRKFRFWWSLVFLTMVVAIASMPMRAGAAQAAAPTAGASTGKSQAAGASDTGEEAVTPEQRAFAEKYAESVQAQDVAKMRALIAPTTLKCFDGAKQKFLDEWIDKQFNYEIPIDYQLSVSRIPPEVAKPTKVATYPVPRTHLMEFQYTRPTNSITVTQEIGTEGGKWYMIPPCPTALRMKQFAKKEELKAIVRDRAEHAYAELKEPVKSQLLALIAKHDNTGAMRLCIKSLHVDAATAQVLLAKLAGDKID